jgi:hypothetical protein
MKTILFLPQQNVNKITRWDGGQRIHLIMKIFKRYSVGKRKIYAQKLCYTVPKIDA